MPLGQPSILLIDEVRRSGRRCADDHRYRVDDQGALGNLAECNEPSYDVISGEERKSVTDTDLITAGESTDGNQLSISVPTDAPDVKTNAPVGSLSTMVLPELRALANQAGVKGTSGMRKNELIAAIQETRGHGNGASAAAAPDPQTAANPPFQNRRPAPKYRSPKGNRTIHRTRRSAGNDAAVPAKRARRAHCRRAGPRWLADQRSRQGPTGRAQHQDRRPRTRCGQRPRRRPTKLRWPAASRQRQRQRQRQQQRQRWR